MDGSTRRAVEICGCADLADVSQALRGRELCTADPAINDLAKAQNENAAWESDEAAHPNRKGASLMADPIAETWAKALGLKVPPKQGDRRTDTGNITIRNTPAPDTDGDGRPDYKDKDWDGDATPNTKDAFPNDPGRSASERPMLEPLKQLRWVGPATPNTRPARNSNPATGPDGTGHPGAPNGPGNGNPGANPPPAGPPQQPPGGGGNAAGQPPQHPGGSGNTGGRPPQPPARPQPPRPDTNPGGGTNRPRPAPERG